MTIVATRADDLIFIHGCNLTYPSDSVQISLVPNWGDGAPALSLVTTGPGKSQLLVKILNLNSQTKILKV